MRCVFNVAANYRVTKKKFLLQTFLDKSFKIDYQ